MATSADDNFQNDLDLSDYLDDKAWYDGQESGLGGVTLDNSPNANTWSLSDVSSAVQPFHSQPMVHNYSAPLSFGSSTTFGGQFGGQFDAGLLAHSAPAEGRPFDTLRLQHWRDPGWHMNLRDGPASWREHSHVSTGQDFPILEADLFHQADGLDLDAQYVAPPMNSSFSYPGEYIAGYDPTKKAPSTLSTGSARSFDTAPEDVMSIDAHQELGSPNQADFPRSAPVDIVQPAESELPLFQYEPTGSEGALVRQPTTAGKKPRGRSGPLSDVSKANAAKMRKVKACWTCKRRKSGCDDGIFCTACIRYHKATLSRQPFLCRARLLTSLADLLVKSHVFPKKRPLSLYLGPTFAIDKTRERTVHLNLGFGEPFEIKAWTVTPDKNERLWHDHVVYPWQGSAQASVGLKHNERHPVYPVVLTDKAKTDLETVLDKQLTFLLDDVHSFSFFPLWQSDLKVLREIYIYYKTLPLGQAKPLRDALKLLITVHIGGDAKVAKSCGCTSSHIVREVFGTRVQPNLEACFIRGELGPIFHHLALTYMRSVLSQLQTLSLSTDSKNFPIIVATFSVFWMTVESIQYHAAKDPYHAHFDVTSDGRASCSVPPPVPGDTHELEQLLKFYHACVGGCHAKLHSDAASFASFAKIAGGSRDFAEASKTFLTSLQAALVKAKSYLELKLKAPTTGSDLTCFFDRRLARFFQPVPVA